MKLLGVIKLKKIALMCDSCADISSQEAKELDIHVIRMPLNVDGKEHIEDVNGTPDINKLDMLMLKNHLDQWKKEVRLQGLKPLIYINYRED